MSFQESTGRQIIVIDLKCKKSDKSKSPQGGRRTSAPKHGRSQNTDPESR